MGGWSDAVVALATVVGAFVAVMGLRGLVETVEQWKGRCADCGRPARLPLPLGRSSCWHCRHGEIHLGRPAHRGAPRHP